MVNITTHNLAWIESPLHGEVTILMDDGDNYFPPPPFPLFPIPTSYLPVQLQNHDMVEYIPPSPHPEAKTVLHFTASTRQELKLPSAFAAMHGTPSEYREAWLCSHSEHIPVVPSRRCTCCSPSHDSGGHQTPPKNKAAQTLLPSSTTSYIFERALMTLSVQNGGRSTREYHRVSEQKCINPHTYTDHRSLPRPSQSPRPGNSSSTNILAATTNQKNHRHHDHRRCLRPYSQHPKEARFPECIQHSRPPQRVQQVMSKVLRR